MKVLTLQIKRNFLDQILSGEKTEEFREILPKNEKKYIITRYDEENNIRHFEAPVVYDAIRFFNGYKKDRPEVLIEVKDAILEYHPDENGNWKEWEFEDGSTYPIIQMAYQLGEILERKNI